MPHFLPIGMCFTLTGLLMLSAAPYYLWLIIGGIVLGIGSSIFHPESARVARMASGGRFGMAQSLFQVGGSAGQACGPLLIAAIVMPRGQYSLSWFAVLPIAAMALLIWVGGRRREIGLTGATNALMTDTLFPPHPKGVILRVFAILLVLIFSKSFYIASINNYFIFYLTHKFGISIQGAQVRLFLFMFALAIGTLLGGPLGDQIGRRYIIWFAVLGAAPFALIMPHLNLEWTSVVIFVTGLILSSAFPAIVVFAQDLLPGHVGTIAGLFFGLSFGMGGIGAAVLGRTADIYGIEAVFTVCSFLPLAGFLAVFLPYRR
jgi:FSR family fosmidomycin resistance protein-like MFS transporter